MLCVNVPLAIRVSRKAQVELLRIAAREANQARSGASQISPATGFTAADMLAAAKVCRAVLCPWLLVT